MILLNINSQISPIPSLIFIEAKNAKFDLLRGLVSKASNVSEMQNKFVKGLCLMVQFGPRTRERLCSVSNNLPQIDRFHCNFDQLYSPEGRKTEKNTHINLTNKYTKIYTDHYRNFYNYQ